MSWTKEDLAAHMSKLTKRRVDHAIQPGYAKGARGRRPRSIPGTMNKTETAYAQHLELQQKVGAIHYYGFEAMKIRIGKNCWLSPDFLILYDDGHLELHDTKGRKKNTYHAEDDAIVKARSVGANFPIPIYFVYRERNGEWAKVEM